MTELSSFSPENSSSHTVRITSVKPLTLKDKNDCALHDIANIIQKLNMSPVFDEEFKSNTQKLNKNYEYYRELSGHDQIINKENHKQLLSLFLEECQKTNKNLENIFSQIKLGDDEDSIKTKKTISKNINLLNEQIKEIPEFMDIDNYKVNKKETSLNEFISEVVKKDIRDGIPDRMHHIRIIRPDNNITCLLDPKLTKKVLENFIYNSVKYSPEGTNIFISSYEDEKEVKISVKDFGIGLSPDELNSFKEFNPGKTIRFAPDKATGSGLGLYNAFSYAIQQGASVEISSGGKNTGLGSTFSLVFKK